MCRSSNSNRFHELLGSFNPNRYVTSRSLALFSAAITVAEESFIRGSIKTCLRLGVTGSELYEVVLQSYLFLGFPRMLSAAETLHDENGDNATTFAPLRVEADDAARWFERGRHLCQKVYAGNYKALKNRVEKMAPEVFLWMELEGYGKVLSRPGLDIIDREIAIVACLMIENRTAQLHSHMRGALNVGAPPELLVATVEDLAPVADEGYTTARQLLTLLEVI